MISPDPSSRKADAFADPHEDRAALLAEISALKAEIVTLRVQRDANAVDAAREEVIRGAVDRLMARDRKERAELTAQLDALIRSSSEVRYRIDAGWNDLIELSGGGFLADASERNSTWVEDYIPEDHRDLVRAEVRRAIAEKDTYHLEHKVNRIDGSVGWALSRAVPLFDENGEITSWMGAASDISDRKNVEELQALLNDELSHRMKNIFSMVQAIVGQTLRQVDDLDEARAVIDARLHTFSRAQDILTGAGPTAADIHPVIRAALAPYQDVGERIDSSGPPVPLTAQQALGLSLAIHELATNALKYGSLSVDTGRVSIEWDHAGGAFSFAWVESGGPVVRDPTRRGFGWKLINDVLASYFDGETRLDFDPDGVRFRLTGKALA